MEETTSQVTERESDGNGQVPRDEREPRSPERVNSARAVETHSEAVGESETACAECGRTAVECRTVLEHEPCGHLGFRDGYTRSNSVDCPDCGVLENEESIVAVGLVYHCDDCGHVTDVPATHVTE